MTKYKIGDVVKGEIRGLQHYGAFVQIDENLVGLIHISEISERFVRNVEDYFQLGDIITVKIIDLDESQNHAKLSIKQLPDSDRIGKKKMGNNFYRKRKYVNDKVDYFSALEESTMESLNKLYGEVNEGIVKIDYSHTKIVLNFDQYQEKINDIHEKMHNKDIEGKEYLGWLDLPYDYSEKEVASIYDVSNTIRNKYDTLVVCGIGGSYLGSRAVIEAINGLYSDDKMKIVYFGNTFSPTYTSQVLEYLKNRNFIVNVISKSGTTTETAIAFRMLKQLLESKYTKDEVNSRIIATTDKDSGLLRKLVEENCYQSFVIPSNIGGRYSVFTPVGLLPIASANIDVYDFLLGAKKAYKDLLDSDLKSNPAYQYALVRYLLYKKGYAVETLINYEPHFAMLAEWWKQLFGESEGKQGKGLLPDSVIFSTDLHSLGQFIQDGSKIMFETILKSRNSQFDVEIKKDDKNFDELNYLSGVKMSYINEQALLGTLSAHEQEGNVPNIIIEYDKMNAFNLGYLLYFFMKSCAMSGYLLGVNPFNQPGVEIYKRNMFKLLGKV